MTRADIMPGWLDTSLSGESIKLHAFCSAKRVAVKTTMVLLVVVHYRQGK